MRYSIPLILAMLLSSLWIASAQVDIEKVIEQERREREKQKQQEAPAPAAEEKAEDSPVKQAEPKQSSGPRVERSSNGVIVIRSSSRKAEAASGQEKTAEGEKTPESDKTPEQGGQKPKEAQQAPKKPSATSSQGYSIDPSGNKITIPATSTRNQESSSSTVQTIRTIHGREVPYIQESEKVVSEGKGEKVVERRVQRYDTEGRPARQQVIREEEKRLADGTIVRTATTFEEDANGHMQSVERKVTREQKTGSTKRTSITTERPSANGGFRAYSQEESVERRQGENKAVVETVRKLADTSGQLQESGREETVMSKQGAVATTETKVWERSTLSGKVELSRRTVGKLVEKPDGSANETIQTYGLSSGGGAVNVNAGGSLPLQETIQKQSQVRPDGEILTTITKENRSVVDPSQMGNKTVTREVSRPTADGKAVETSVYEQGVNGQMRPTQVVVEQIKK